MTRATIRQALREAHLDDYAVPSDGANDAYADFQQLLDNMAADGGGTITGRLGAAYLVNTPLAWPNGVHFNGAGLRPGASGGSAWIKGASGQDVIVLSSDANQNGMSFRNARITGGATALKSERLAYDVTLENLELSGSDAAIRVGGSIERWTARDVLLSGGDYGFRMVHGLVAGSNYMDKCLWQQVRTNGQSKNGWRIEGALSNTCTWINPVINSAGEHGFYADIGAIGWTFVQYNSETIGTSGKNARTTGTISSGSNSLVVASATGFAQGDPIVVQGAGANGADLYSTISSIAGTTFTLVDNASTSVTGLRVTNASFDDIHFANTLAGTGPTDVSFVGGNLGAEGASGKLRYAVNAQTGRVTFLGAVANNRPVYDPTFRTMNWGGDVSVRQPSGVSALNPLYPTLPIGGTREGNRGIIPSPGGKPLTIFINDSNLNGTGSYGDIEIRRNDANRTLLCRINGATGSLFLRPQSLPATCVAGEMAMDSNNKLNVCTATNTWTVVGSQS